MKALVKAKAEPGLWLQDVPEPAVGINDVLIKVLKTGICGTDVKMYKQPLTGGPVIMGHENIGVIA
jgi:threonine 3-dehydrogenase